ncbi:hypothetical protein ABZV78_04485 [Micromonospora sp. NPDC004540]|uniref:hypothetical protein n=1 Tax=Micromonospora sp. NPDC004540 TaxID=3154457 RepID=UPI0033AC2632
MRRRELNSRLAERQARTRRDHRPRSSACDRAHNRHRDGLAWSKTAVRTITHGDFTIVLL